MVSGLGHWEDVWQHTPYYSLETAFHENWFTSSSPSMRTSNAEWSITVSPWSHSQWTLEWNTRMCSVTRVILSRNRLGYEDRHTRQKTGIAVDSDLNPRGTGLCWLPLSQQTPRHRAKDIVPQQNRNEINNYKTQNTTNSDPILGGVSLGFIVLLENFSLIWRRHHFRWRAPNCDSLVGSADPGVGVFVSLHLWDFASQVCEHQSVL